MRRRPRRNAGESGVGDDVSCSCPGLGSSFRRHSSDPAFFQRAVPVAHRHVRGPHFDAVPAGVLHQLRRRVEAHRQRVEQRAGERRGLVALEPRGDVDDEGERRRMRFRKAVLAEAQDLLVDLPCERLGIAARRHPVDQALLEVLEAALAPPRRHRAPQMIGFARREPRRDDRELHHLLLEDRHAERALEHAPDRIAGIRDGFDALPPAQVGMHHPALDGAGAHDGDLDHEIVEARRFEPRQHRLLRARLDLEHADGVGALAHRVDLGVFGGDVLQGERAIPATATPCRGSA